MGTRGGGEEDEVESAGGKFQSFLRVQVYAERAPIQALEAHNSLRRRGGQEHVLMRGQRAALGG